MGLTGEVSRFVATSRLDDVPADTRQLAKRSILDGIGLAVAGARSDVHRIAREHVAAAGSAQAASMLGTGMQGSLRGSAFVNGIGIHAHDYDDTQLAVAVDRVYGLLTHPTAPVLPAALALVEREDGSGEDLLVAYLTGVDVACKVAEAIDPRHYHDGFHTTGTAGTIGAAAAAARASHLDTERTAVALGVAASQSAGLRENFGTMTKPFHAGRAAESGIIAADLSARGMSAAGNILEARRGFFRAAGGGYDPALIEGRLGNPWVFADPGISIKPHPSGSLTHPAMWVVLQLAREHDLDAAAVERVTVGTNSSMPNALIHHRPTNELQAKFSMEFCVAILLLERRAGLPEFSDEVVSRPDVRALIERVDFTVDERAEAAGYAEMLSFVRIELRDGRVLEARGAYGKGHPRNPMSDAELTDKFLGCMEWAGVPGSLGIEVAARILALEHERSLRSLIRQLESHFSRRPKGASRG
ncbi:MAG: MmgE/PrpD family protein [Nitriliruptorales bacterium]|nr:MmgE/PrpD family protein [Nitriliruptorales bacterium]